MQVSCLLHLNSGSLCSFPSFIQTRAQDGREPQRPFTECRPVVGGSWVLLYYLDSVPLILHRAVMSIYHGQNYLF